MLGLFFLYACGKEEFPDYSEEDPVIQREELFSTYKASFELLNQNQTGPMEIRSLLWIRDNQFYVRIFLKGNHKGIRYQQIIHRGEECPSYAATYTDVLLISGQSLIPLDGSLETADDGSEWFPRSRRSGAYVYSRSVGYNVLLKHLWREQRLPRFEELNLAKRVILIYGGTRDPLLPVACATIEEVY